MALGWFLDGFRTAPGWLPYGQTAGCLTKLLDYDMFLISSRAFLCFDHTNSSSRVVLEWSWGFLEPPGARKEGNEKGNETNPMMKVGFLKEEEPGWTEIFENGSCGSL